MQIKACTVDKLQPQILSMILRKKNKTWKKHSG